MRPALVVFLLAFVGLGLYAAVVRGAFSDAGANATPAPEATTTPALEAASGGGAPDVAGMQTAPGAARATAAPQASSPYPAVRSAAAGGASVQMTQDVVTEYTVTGDTEDEILRSLVMGGPSNEGEQFFGMTQADMRLEYRTAETNTECFLVDVEVRLGVETTLPAWDRPRGVDGALRSDWHRFLSALTRHEARHKEIVEEGAAKVYRAVASLRRPTCAEVEAEARRRLDRIEIEMEAAHRLYDEQTGHGRTEGAAWPLP
ncbi:MAG: DUF922 domain-containing protein [Bacteroidota bacterium]